MDSEEKLFVDNYDASKLEYFYKDEDGYYRSRAEYLYDGREFVVHGIRMTSDMGLRKTKILDGYDVDTFNKRIGSYVNPYSSFYEFILSLIKAGSIGRFDYYDCVPDCDADRLFILNVNNDTQFVDESGNNIPYDSILGEPITFTPIFSIDFRYHVCSFKRNFNLIKAVIHNEPGLPKPWGLELKPVRKYSTCPTCKEDITNVNGHISKCNKWVNSEEFEESEESEEYDNMTLAKIITISLATFLIGGVVVKLWISKGSI